jgi:hypothetical protein
MFEKIGKSAQRLASAASVSRRGFFGRLARLAGGVALGALTVATPKAAAGIPSFCYLPCCGCACYEWWCRADYRRLCRRPC